MERISHRGRDEVREFVEFAIVIWFVVTVTGLLIGGVVRHAVEAPARQEPEEPLVQGPAPAEDHTPTRTVPGTQDPTRPRHMPGEPAEARS
jgi:cell division protein FtsN